MSKKNKSFLYGAMATLLLSFSLAYAEDYIEVDGGNAGNTPDEVAARDGAPSLYDQNRDRIQQEARQARRSSYYTQDEYYYSSPGGFNNNNNQQQNYNQNNAPLPQGSYYQDNPQPARKSTFRGPINPELRR